MAEEELVSGEGWISDDSSFYGESLEQAVALHSQAIDRRSHFSFRLLTHAGDEEEQDRQLSLGDDFNPKRFWSVHKSDLNTTLAPSRAQKLNTTMPTTENNQAGVTSLNGPSATDANLQANVNPPNFPLDRRAMEESRLARLGKRVREPSPEPVLCNPGQGSPDSWQLGESVDDFVRRVPPLTTADCAWIWAHNPRRDPHEGSTSHNVNEFRSRGKDLLDQSLQSRQQIQKKGAHGPQAAMTKALNGESKALQQRITDLAVKCDILSGKVSAK